MGRPCNGFLSALSADDYELIRPHLRTVDLHHETVLVETGEMLKRAYFPHRGVISLVVELARGEHVQVAMIGRDSLLGALSIMGDAGLGGGLLGVALLVGAAIWWTQKRPSFQLRLQLDDGEATPFESQDEDLVRRVAAALETRLHAGGA